eukprot:COSAG06_NODE_245_length_19176_cov_167.625151_18_plen_134_part_00
MPRSDCARRARAGWHDTQVHNPASFMTGTFGALAKAGIVLERQHSYKYCSPTRRSSASTPLLFRQRPAGLAAGCRLSRPLIVPAVLSGRFPVHITGTQAPVCSNYLPLQFSILPKKLKELGGYEVRQPPRSPH